MIIKKHLLDTNSIEPLYLPWLGTLALVSSIVSLRAVAFPLWPHSNSLNQKTIENSMEKLDLKFALLETIPQTRQFERATSPGLRYRLNGRYNLTIFNGTVRQRFNFQLAFLGRIDPDTQLKNRSILNNPLAASGVINGRPSIQTCVVQDVKLSISASGVTRHQLGLLADEAAKHTAYSPSQVIGLTPNRAYSCTLVSLSSHSQKDKVDQDLFYRLIRSLESAKLTR